MLQLLTTTGARPEAWRLCMRYMARQTYAWPVRWIVVDDGPQPQPPPAPRSGWDIRMVRPAELWRPGLNTQIANLKAGLALVSDEHPLAIIEDDDVYAAGWLDRIADELDRHSMVGQRLCRKYNLRTRRAKEFRHAYRASLCATAVRDEALRRLRRIVTAAPRLIDGVLWRPGLGHLFEGAYVTGLKCLPGRAGIDSGHRRDFGDIADPSGALLAKWIGEDDAKEYQAMHLSPERDHEIAAYVEAYKQPTYRMGVRRRLDVQIILSNLRPPGSLLDIGTGRGETLAFARTAGHGPLLQGTEVVPDLLRHGVIYAEAHALPFEDGAYDHVTCFDVLEHLTEPDIAPALREMLRVARRTVTVSASERPDVRGGRDLHISKRPRAEWLALIRSCWGPSARVIGSAGASPAFQVRKGRA